VLTVNTDFAQVEADEQQINLTRFSLFFPERRDFFLQDSDIFEFGRLEQDGRPFFSRTIGISANGQEVPIDHIAPSLMAIDVPAGEHDVLFRYRNPRYQKILFLLALGGFITAIAVETRRASAPTPRGDGDLP